MHAMHGKLVDSKHTMSSSACMVSAYGKLWRSSTRAEALFQLVFSHVFCFDTNVPCSKKI